MPGQEKPKHEMSFSDRADAGWMFSDILVGVRVFTHACLAVGFIGIASSIAIPLYAAITG